jgi:preprotein translocase subunit SecD
MLRATLLILLAIAVPGCASRPAFEVHAASFEGDGKLAAQQPLYGEKPVFVAPEVVLTGDDIASAALSNDIEGRKAVLLVFTESGAKKMAALSEKQINKPIAFFIDGKLVSTPIVRTRLRTMAIITGGPTGLDDEIARKMIDGYSR